MSRAPKAPPPTRPGRGAPPPPPPEKAARQGVFIGGRFQIMRKLGEGGMGQVYQGYDHQLRRPVAIKRLLPALSHHGPSAARFLVEARAVAALNHPNVVQIHDIGEDARGKYIVMEYVEGESLAQRVQWSGKYSARDAIHLMLQVVRGLRAAHERGVIHRDIKPGNVLITRGGIPKLADFGLAQLAQSRDLTATGTAMGTWNYASPEQLADAKRVDHRSDLFSCGAMLYELVTGESPRHIHEREVPDVLRPVVMKCLAPKPDDRYASAQELLAALSDAYRKITTAPLPPTPPVPGKVTRTPAPPTADMQLWEGRRLWWSRPMWLGAGVLAVFTALTEGGAAQGAIRAWAMDAQRGAPAEDAAALDALFSFPWAAALVVLALLFFVFPLWGCLGTSYRLTTSRVVVRRGLLLRRETDYPLYEIREGQVYRGVFGMLLGYGNVRLLRTGKAPVLLEGVRAPVAVKEAVIGQALRGRR